MILPEILAILNDAAGFLRGFDLIELQWVADEGLLELVIERMPDDSLTYEFARSDRALCWDGCNGLTRTHRGGWCLTNPAHADFDCGCGEDDWPEDDGFDPAGGYLRGTPSSISDIAEAF